MNKNFEELLDNVSIQGLTGKSLYDELYRYFDRTAEHYHDLQQAKQQKKSVDQWLCQKLNETKLGLNEALKEKLTDSTIQKVKWEDLLLEVEIATFNKSEFLNDSFDSIQIENDKVDPDVEVALNSPYYSEEDTKIKTKIAATYINEISKNTWESGVQVADYAAIVDRAYNIQKSGYLVETKKMYAVDVVHKLIDSAAARAATTVEIVAKQKGRKLGEIAGDFIARQINPVLAPVLKEVGGYVGEYCGKKVGGFARKGIEKISSGAKNIASAVGTGIKNMMSIFS